MIHINKHSNSSPPLSSTMCGRRHKGMVQTSLILVLLLCLGYGFYLYNLLQIKIKYLDTKSLRHQSEQQSLSAQLQTAYEDRARLEKSVKKSKIDYQNLKDEKETMIQEMLVEHQDKHQKLQKENKELKEKNKDISASNQDIKTKYDRVYKEHEDLKSKHQKSLLEQGEMVNIAHVDLRRCQSENEAVQQDRIRLKQQIDGLNADYRSLQDTLKLIPADAVNFNHPATRDLKPDVKQFIIGHLGERRDDLVQAEQKLAEEQHQAIQPGPLNQQQDEHPPPDDQQNVQHRVDRFIASEVVDICGFHVEHGPCQSEELRYGYYNDVGDCRVFSYGGCGGNLNNFKTMDECVRICNDPAQRYVKKEVTDEELAARMQKQEVIDHNDIAPVEDQHSDNEPHQVVAHDNKDGVALEAEVHPDQQDQPGLDGGNLPLEQQNVVDVPQEEEDQPDHYENGNNMDGDEDEQSKLINQAEIQAIGEEEAAKQELENQQEHVTVLSDVENPLKRLKENSRLQIQMAQDQHADFEKALGQNHREQNPDQIEGHIVDEMNKEEEDLMQEDVGEDDENDLEDMQDGMMKDDSEHVQVVVPPAAQVAENDPEAFVNAPPAKEEDIDSEDVNGQNIFEVGNGNDPLMRDAQEEEEFYEQDNQQDDDDPGLNVDPGEEEDDDDQNDEFDDDKIDDQKFEDDYANDVEDPKEKEYRQQREKKRIFHDKNFDAMNNVQNMIPQLNLRRK